MSSRNLPQVVTTAALDVGDMMMALAGLSFLGLAAQPPAPEWGYMLYESRTYMQTAPWMMIFPGLALLITVIVFNLLGDSVRDMLDPRRSEIINAKIGAGAKVTKKTGDD